MKILTIGIKSERELMRDFKSAFEAAQKRLPFKTRSGSFFASLEDVRNFLTPKRLELLGIIKEKNPHSLYELAQLVDRSFSSVFRDIELLRRHGLVSLTRKPSHRKPVYPEVHYDAINLWIGI